MPEQLLGEDIRRQVAQILEGIDSDVELVLVAGDADDTADLAEALLDEVASISPHLSAVRLGVEEAREAGFETDHTPSIHLRRPGAPAPRFRFLGAPTGYEFGTLIEDIRDVANGTTSLSDETKEYLASLSGRGGPNGEAAPLHLEVFSTPT